MHKLILIRHSKTKPTGDLPGHLWPLTPVGVERAKKLAKQLEPYDIGAMYASSQAKAIETGEIISAELQIPFSGTNADFDENNRSGEPFYEDMNDFFAAIENFFLNPTKVVMGNESADAARTRFTKAVEAVVAKHPNDNPAIVTHGTILTLFLTQHTGDDLYKTWQSVQAAGMPHFAVLDLLTSKLEGIYPLNQS